MNLEITLTPSQSAILNQLVYLQKRFRTRTGKTAFYQTNRQLSEYTDYARRTVQSAIKHLENLGVLWVKRCAGARGSNLYAINYKRLDELYQAEIDAQSDILDQFDGDPSEHNDTEQKLAVVANRPYRILERVKKGQTITREEAVDLLESGLIPSIPEALIKAQGIAPTSFIL